MAVELLDSTIHLQYFITVMNLDSCMYKSYVLFLHCGSALSISSIITQYNFYTCRGFSGKRFRKGPLSHSGPSECLPHLLDAHMFFISQCPSVNYKVIILHNVLNVFTLGFHYDIYEKIMQEILSAECLQNYFILQGTQQLSGCRVYFTSKKLSLITRKHFCYVKLP